MTWGGICGLRCEVLREQERKGGSILTKELPFGFLEMGTLIWGQILLFSRTSPG